MEKEAWSVFPSFLSLFFLSYPFLFLAVKGVTYNTLIRLGLLWGIGTGAYDKGTFGKHWGCHHPKLLFSLYNNLKRKLRSYENNPFSSFDVLTLLMGERNAFVFCKYHLSLDYRTSLDSLSTSDFVNSHSMVIDN